MKKKPAVTAYYIGDKVLIKHRYIEDMHILMSFDETFPKDARRSWAVWLTGIINRSEDDDETSYDDLKVKWSSVIDLLPDEDIGE